MSILTPNDTPRSNSIQVHSGEPMNLLRFLTGRWCLPKQKASRTGKFSTQQGWWLVYKHTAELSSPSIRQPKYASPSLMSDVVRGQGATGSSSKGLIILPSSLWGGVTINKHNGADPFQVGTVQFPKMAIACLRGQFCTLLFFQSRCGKHLLPWRCLH